MSMAMSCCHKEYAEECEILVCVAAPAPHNPGLYKRLRFGLLASSWLPRPLGIFLWSALHVTLLIVGGPVFGVLGLLTDFLIFSVFMFGFWGITCFLKYVLLGLAVVPADLYLLACHRPTVEWRGGDCLTVESWKKFKSEMRENWDFVPIGVPCMSGSLHKETMNRRLKIWARWCEEVLHMHDAIAL